MVAAPAPRRDFDAAYYRRFYGRRPVHGRRAIGRLAEGVLGLCALVGHPGPLGARRGGGSRLLA